MYGTYAQSPSLAKRASHCTMFSLKLLLITLSAFCSLSHSQQFQIQNWGNGEDATNYTYKSLEAGRFTLDWILGAGGNFVAGKGYRGSQNLYVLSPKVATLTD
jgi:endo-1,4-beta-xylanase